MLLAATTVAAALTATAPAAGAGAQEQFDVPEGRIVFASDRDGDSEIYAVDTDGSRLRQITHNDFYDGAPTWHPSGNRVAYLTKPGYRDHIRVENLLTGKTRRVVDPHEDLEFEEPQYSPNGKWIAYVQVFYGAWHDLRAV